MLACTLVFRIISSQQNINQFYEEESANHVETEPYAGKLSRHLLKGSHSLLDVFRFPICSPSFGLGRVTFPCRTVSSKSMDVQIHMKAF